MKSFKMRKRAQSVSFLPQLAVLTLARCILPCDCARNRSAVMKDNVIIGLRMTLAGLCHTLCLNLARHHFPTDLAPNGC